MVLPASAGMIPNQDYPSVILVSAPRIRGDDPQIAGVKQTAARCSPHPRG